MDTGIELFNGPLRDECVNVNQFLTIEDTKGKIRARWLAYDYHRPHSPLAHLTPRALIQSRQGRPAWHTAEVQR